MRALTSLSGTFFLVFVATLASLLAGLSPNAQAKIRVLHNEESSLVRGASPACTTSTIAVGSCNDESNQCPGIEDFFDCTITGCVSCTAGAGVSYNLCVNQGNPVYLCNYNVNDGGCGFQYSIAECNYANSQCNCVGQNLTTFPCDQQCQNLSDNDCEGAVVTQPQTPQPPTKRP